MATAENPFAGQGPVVLDIGDDVGALIVAMPAWMDGVEVEIIPSGTDQRGRHQARPAENRERHEHLDGSGHHDHHGHEHDGHEHDGRAHDGHSHQEAAPPHVAVVARPLPDGSTMHTLVYGELTDGTYDLYVRPDGAVQLTASVTGGQITQAHWPQTLRV